MTFWNHLYPRTFPPRTLVCTLVARHLHTYTCIYTWQSFGNITILQANVPYILDPGGRHLAQPRSDEDTYSAPPLQLFSEREKRLVSSATCMLKLNNLQYHTTDKNCTCTCILILGGAWEMLTYTVAFSL